MVENIALDKMAMLHDRNEDLLKELFKLRSKPQGKIGYALIGIGSALLAMSIDYSHLIAAFVSLTLVFWGLLFLYIRPSNYIRQEVLFSTLREIYGLYTRLLEIQGYEGVPVYYSPKTLTEFSSVYLYIPKEKGRLVSDEAILSSIEDHKVDDFIRIIPIGSNLSNLMEEEVKMNLSTLNLTHLLSIINGVLVEDLELVKRFEYTMDDKKIQIKITDPIADNSQGKKAARQEEDWVMNYINNSIACLIAKSTHKPIIIENSIMNENGRVNVTEYKIL